MKKNEQPRLVIDIEDLREVASQKKDEASEKEIVKVTGGGCRPPIKTSTMCPL